jgi:hypothetical protein
MKGNKMSASVKIMLSYDYCHFEVCKSTDENISDREINELRKDVQRLADEAVRQYKFSKNMAAKREKTAYEKEEFVNRVKRIMDKPEGERTVSEVAILKQYQDENWEARFNYDYDYEDDDETYNW